LEVSLGRLELVRFDGHVQTIRTVLNPDKLGRLAPVADAWAVVRETNRARRSPV